MDYKEKYLKGLEEAKKTLDSLDEHYRCHELTKDDIRGIYSRLFPELAESDEERIRKELIFFLKEEIPQCSIKEHADKLKAFVSYLENQKPSFRQIHDSVMWDSGLRTGIELKKQKESLRDFINDFPYSDVQKEQKPAEGKEYSSPECGTTAGVWSEEDERIRKELIKEFEEKLHKCFEWKEGIPNRRVLDWLEKQKEQKPDFSEKDSTDFEIEVHEIIAQARNDSRLNDADVLKQFEEEAAFALMLKANKLIEQKQIDNPNTQNIIKSFVDSMSPDESLTGIEYDLALYAQLLAHYKAIKSDVQYNNALKGFAIAVKESLNEPKAVDISANFEKAEKEKKDFVTSEFIQCIKKVNGFNEGEAYWIEYIGDDMYVGRSDNVLNSIFNITPKELFTHFRRLNDFGVKVGVWKIIPLFKVGDFIKKKGGNYAPWKITEVNEEGGYYCGNYQHGYPTELMFKDQRDYERVDNPGMGVPKINGKPVSTENNVVKLTVDDGKQ